METQIHKYLLSFIRNLMNYRLEMNLYYVGCCLFGCFFFFAVNSMELQVWMTLLMSLILRASFCLQQQNQTCIGKKHRRLGNPPQKNCAFQFFPVNFSHPSSPPQQYIIIIIIIIIFIVIIIIILLCNEKHGISLDHSREWTKEETSRKMGAAIYLMII